MLYAQQDLSGQIVNGDNEPLAFVNIVVNADHRQVTTTDIDGKFELTQLQANDTLILTYVGYQTRIMEVKTLQLKSSLQIEMTPTVIGLETVTVFAGENPAHRIIRKVIENSDRNNPDKYSQYSCRTYNKMRFASVPQQPFFDESGDETEAIEQLSAKEAKQVQQWGGFVDSFYISIMETVTEKQFLYPNHYRETILHNKMAGLKKPEFVSLAKDAQPFSFYSPTINILSETYLNPISKGSTNIYFFDWTETIITGQDTSFIITFRPKKGKTFEGLKGVLSIHSNGYAIQNVIATPADAMKTHITIEQKYVYHASAQKWFPEQLNIEWLMEKYPAEYLGIKMDGRSYITAVDFDVELSKRDFTRDRYEMAAGVFDSDMKAWESLRVDSLTSKERATYAYVDSVSVANNVETKLAVFQSILSGKLKAGKVDVDIERLIAFNDYEGTRFGIGVRTNKGLSKVVSVGGYAAYGWQDQAWKYGADLQVLLSPKHNASLTATYTNDLLAPGQLDLPRWQSPFSTAIQGLYQPVFDRNETFSMRLNHQLLKNIDVEWQLLDQRIQPNNDYAFVRNDQELNRFQFREMNVKLRYAYGEQTVTFMGIEQPIETPFPILHLNLTHGLWLLSQENVLYQRYALGIEQQVSLHRWGQFAYSLEAGWQSGDVPLTKLFLSSGLGSGFRLNFIPNLFQTMQANEFVSDQFAHLFLRWNIGTLTKKSVYFQPELSLIHNAAYGRLTTPIAQHLNVPLNTLEKGFHESGLEINHLLRIPYANIAYLGLGGGIYYRHGAYQLPTRAQNLGYRLLLQFSF